MAKFEVAALVDLMPHRGEMVWIDSVDEFNESTARCSATLRRDALYFSNGTFDPSSYIEWIAQAVGYSAGLRLREQGGKGLAEAFLVGIRDGWFQPNSQLAPGAIIQIAVETIRDLPPLTLVKGTLLFSGTPFAGAILKLFGRP